jgi:small subunit ribosomal protein S4e
MIKRIAMPKSWPLARKSKYTYVIKPKGSQENSIALLIALRDLLGIVKTRREAEKILNSNGVLVNNNVVKDEAFPVYPFDVISFPKIKKYFVLVFKGKRFALEEIDGSKAKSKPYKIIGKTLLKKRKVQLNLFQGKNFILSEKEAATLKVNDSVIVDFEQNKITKHLPLKEKSEIIVIGGKHVGERGKISKIEVKRNLIFIDTKKGEIKAPKEKILVTG